MKRIRKIPIIMLLSFLLIGNISVCSLSETITIYLEELEPNTVLSVTDETNYIFNCREGLVSQKKWDYSGSGSSWTVSFGESCPNLLQGTQAIASQGVRGYFGNNITITVNSNGYYIEPPTPPAKREESSPVHTHDFVTGTIYDATCDTDGLEGTYCKTCGFIKESSPISAFGFTLEKYAQEKMDAAKSGQTIVLEFGTLNSFPKTFMEKIAAKVASGVSFEFRYKWNNKLQKITIPAYSTVDTNLDWYGPATMEQLYGAN